LAAAVQALAQQTRVVQVAVWGALPVHRERLHQDLAPLGDRVRIAGFDDIDLKNFFSTEAISASKETRR